MSDPAFARHLSDPSERRASRRLRAGDLPTLTARLVAGPDVVLIDVSRGGARFESENRLLPGTNVGLRLVQQDRLFLATARVVRSRVARIESGKLRYESAVAFEKDCPLVAEYHRADPVADVTVDAPLETVADASPDGASDLVEAMPAAAGAPTFRIVSVKALLPKAAPGVRHLLSTNRW